MPDSAEPGQDDHWVSIHIDVPERLGPSLESIVTSLPTGSYRYITIGETAINGLSAAQVAAITDRYPECFFQQDTDLLVIMDDLSVEIDMNDVRAMAAGAEFSEWISALIEVATSESALTITSRIASHPELRNYEIL